MRVARARAGLASAIAFGILAGVPARTSTNDPFTQLFDRKTYEMLDLAMAAERPVGCGIKIGERESGFHVEHVFRGYDAADKGVREGDTIVEVDGQPPLLLGRDEVQ